jgi:hypothetical protein
MIALQSDCLIFQLTNGESVPCSADMITVEIAGNNEGLAWTQKPCATPPRPCFIISKSSSSAKPSPSVNLPRRWKKLCMASG